MFIKSGDLSRVLQKTQIKDSQNSQVSCFLVNDLKVQGSSEGSFQNPSKEGSYPGLSSAF